MRLFVACFLAFQHGFYTSRMRSLSLSLPLHVCLPAASPSLQHVLTVQWHSMLPCRPPGISDELWALELPSILGVAHSDLPDSPEPSSPSALPDHPEPGPVHPVSPRQDASPAGPHTTLHRHVPSTSSCEPHSTSADVLLLDLSATEDDHSPDTQVPAKLAVDSYDSEWNVPSPDLKLVLDLTAVPSDLWRSPAPPTVLVAESQAYALLHQGYATFDDIEALLDSLPGHPHAKRRKQQCEVGHPRQCSFSAGAFTFSFSTGIQRNTTSFPLVVQVLTSILRGACPGIQFSSLTIQRNVQVRMHTDKYNERDLESVIVPCSRWQGGSLSTRWRSPCTGQSLRSGHNETNHLAIHSVPMQLFLGPPATGLF